jgi:hypothetical protein
VLAGGAFCWLFNQDSQRVKNMSNMQLIARVGQGLLAVAATGVSALVLQLAMVA